MMAAIIGTSCIVLLINALVYLTLGWTTTKTRMNHELEITARIYAENVSAALSFSDERAATTLLSSLKSIAELDLACVYSATEAEQDPTLFSQYKAVNAQVSCAPRRLPLVSKNESRYIESVIPVHVGDEQLGYVYLRRNVSDLVASTQVAALAVFVTLLICIAIAYRMTSFFRGLIEKPISSLLGATQKLSSETDFTTRVEKYANDEIGQLFDSFNTMMIQIQERDHQLQSTRGELEIRVKEVESSNGILNDTLARLKNTQEQLVNQEKMASLGGLVAGVAHEINTPIGVGVTASSTLHSATEETLEAYEKGKLTDSGLRRYMSTATQSANILLNNLNRAANLIHSFKQVAVDQTSSETRRFNLREYINEILLSLRPRIKKTRVVVNVDVDESIALHSYPGAISQILTNLVMNSLIHGFPDDEQAGEICLSAVLAESDMIRLSYSDNGAGMSELHLHKVFDPFFTTRRGSGGSGLGMHIVYNLVNQQLGGTIDIHSELGKGVELTLIFPMNIQSQGVTL
ncbi:MAG: two-component system NtrC family sensor kinase [Paracoccaceae bacterium]|jgi:two-component system NtrC family sensor kinase